MPQQNNDGIGEFANITNITKFGILNVLFRYCDFSFKAYVPTTKASFYIIAWL